MKPNPLSDREKALEDQWIRVKEKQMAKERAAKKQEEAKHTSSTEASIKGHGQASQKM
ncbi:hypothetical protein VTI74DRAFT_3992 [Chaetomium olivicolor]